MMMMVLVGIDQEGRGDLEGIEEGGVGEEGTEVDGRTAESQQVSVLFSFASSCGQLLKLEMDRVCFYFMSHVSSALGLL